MPQVAGDDAVIVISSSSEEERGKGRRRSRSSVRPCHHSAVADSVSGNRKDGVKKKKKKTTSKEGKEESATPANEGVRRGGEEARAESEGKVKKRKKTEEHHEKKKVEKAIFQSSCAVGVVAASDGVGGRSPTRRFPMNRTEGLAEASESMGGVAKKGKKRNEQIGKGAEAGEAHKTEEKKKKKRKKNEEEKEKKATPPASYAKDVVAANGEVGCRSTAGGESMDGVRMKGNKKKKKQSDEETGTVASGEVPSGGVETKKKKSKEAGKKEATSPVSYAGDVVATSDENGCPSPTCSFPMRRVKRLIAGSEGGGGNSSSSNVRTTLDAVFLINKAAELFLELFAQDAFAHATEELKRSIFYKHLSSTVGNEKRYEFLSDFVPEKVKAADALKALAEQP